MPAEIDHDSELEIVHVLFIDSVGYSKLPIDQQSERLRQLNQIVRETDQFRAVLTTSVTTVSERTEKTACG